MEELFQQHGIASPFLHFVDAPEVIGYHEHPTKALKEKPNSSIAIGFRYLAEGKIDAFLSAGNTGAMLVGAMFSIKPIKGVLRPTIATLLPKLNGNTGILVDVGLNTDCKPEQLNQFAILGNLYAKHILNINAQTLIPAEILVFTNTNDDKRIKLLSDNLKSLLIVKSVVLSIGSGTINDSVLSYIGMNKNYIDNVIYISLPQDLSDSNLFKRCKIGLLNNKQIPNIKTWDSC